MPLFLDANHRFSFRGWFTRKWIAVFFMSGCGIQGQSAWFVSLKMKRMCIQMNVTAIKTRQRSVFWLLSRVHDTAVVLSRVFTIAKASGSTSPLTFSRLPGYHGDSYRWRPGVKGEYGERGSLDDGRLVMNIAALYFHEMESIWKSSLMYVCSECRLNEL